jgi:hypothetical protein
VWPKDRGSPLVAHADAGGGEEAARGGHLRAGEVVVPEELQVPYAPPRRLPLLTPKRRCARPIRGGVGLLVGVEAVAGEHPPRRRAAYYEVFQARLGGTFIRRLRSRNAVPPR